MTQRKAATNKQAKRKQPLVSVIIPVYNAEKTIGRCIDSLINQTIADQIEIIAIDDGSTDGSLEILQSYESKNVKVVKAGHMSTGQIRNIGLGMTHGEYIGFVDADDYVSKNWGQEIKNCLAKTNDASLIIFRYNTRKGPQLLESKFNPRVANISKLANRSVQSQHDLIWGLSLFVWDKLFKKEIVDHHGITFPNTYYAEDTAFLVKFINNCQTVSFIDKPLYVHIDDNSTSTTKHISEKWSTIFESFADIINYYRRAGIFATYEYAICMLALGFYKRRMIFMSKLKYSKSERKLVEGFINEAFQFFDANFRNTWPERFAKWWPNYSFMTNKSKAIQYITNARKNNRIRTLISKFKHNKTKYAYYRKYLPIRDKVLLAQSFWGETSDSPYYFAREGANSYGLHAYLVSSDQFQARNIVNNDIWTRQPTITKPGSKEYIKLLATAKYIICNDSLPAWFNKRPEQVLINTWHGTPLKTLGKDMTSEIGRYMGYVQNNFLMSDYLLYPNSFTYKHMSDAYYLNKLFNNTSIILGYPRNVALFDRKDRTKRREYYGLANKRVFVYMPTWRVNSKRQQDIEQYTNELTAIFDELDPLLNDDVVIYVKMHHLLSAGKLDLKKYHHIMAVDPLIENYQFLNMADCLITDYSSVMFDYAASNRNVVLFDYDYDEYLKNRGVYIDIDKLPFDKVQTTQQLAQYINNFTLHQQHYDKQAVNKFWQYDSPNNASKLCQLVFNDDNNSIQQKQSRQANKFNVIFAPNNLSKVEEIIEQLSTNDLLVFHKSHLSGEIERLVIQNLDNISQLLVAQPQAPITVGEHLIRSVYRKTGLLKSLTRRYYRKELDRILPNISVSSFTNYSHIKRFADITKLFPNGRKVNNG